MRAALFPGSDVEPADVATDLDPDHELVVRASEILDYDIVKRTTQAARRTRKTMTPRFGHPAIFVASLVDFQRTSEQGTRFDRLAGHGLGEVTALVAGGSIGFESGLRVVVARAEYMRHAARNGSSGMAAVLHLDLDAVERIATLGRLTVANDDSPDRMVLSGPNDALTEAARAIRRAGGRCVLLSGDSEFHGPLMREAASALDKDLMGIEVTSPRIPVISNVTARPYRDPEEIRRLLSQSLTVRVRFRESLLYLASIGVRSFTDIGPGRTVGALASSTCGTPAELVRD